MPSNKNKKKGKKGKKGNNSRKNKESGGTTDDEYGAGVRVGVGGEESVEDVVVGGREGADVVVDVGVVDDVEGSGGKRDERPAADPIADPPAVVVADEVAHRADPPKDKFNRPSSQIEIEIEVPQIAAEGTLRKPGSSQTEGAALEIVDKRKLEGAKVDMIGEEGEEEPTAVEPSEKEIAEAAEEEVAKEDMTKEDDKDKGDAETNNDAERKEDGAKEGVATEDDWQSSKNKVAEIKEEDTAAVEVDNEDKEGEIKKGRPLGARLTSKAIHSNFSEELEKSIDQMDNSQDMSGVEEIYLVEEDGATTKQELVENDTLCSSGGKRSTESASSVIQTTDNGCMNEEKMHKQEDGKEGSGEATKYANSEVDSEKKENPLGAGLTLKATHSNISEDGKQFVDQMDNPDDMDEMGEIFHYDDGNTITLSTLSANSSGMNGEYFRKQEADEDGSAEVTECADLETALVKKERPFGAGFALKATYGNISDDDEQFMDRIDSPRDMGGMEEIDLAEEEDATTKRLDQQLEKNNILCSSDGKTTTESASSTFNTTYDGGMNGEQSRKQNDGKEDGEATEFAELETASAKKERPLGTGITLKATYNSLSDGDLHGMDNPGDMDVMEEVDLAEEDGATTKRLAAPIVKQFSGATIHRAYPASGSYRGGDAGAIPAQTRTSERGEAFQFLTARLRESLGSDADNVSDDELGRYLRWKPDVARAAERWRRNQQFREDNPYVFGGWRGPPLLSRDPRLALLLRRGAVLAPEELVAKDGSAVMIVRARLCGEASSSRSDIIGDEDICRAVFYVVRRVIEREDPSDDRPPGVTIILDMTGAMRKNIPGKVQKLLSEARSAFPLRVRSICIVAKPWWFLSGSKRWVLPKMRGRVHYLRDKTSLSEFIVKDRLLEEDGGIYHFDLQSWTSLTISKEIIL